MFEQFHFTPSDGTDEIVIPRMDKLKAKDLRETRKLDGEDRGWTLLERVADEKLMARIDELPGADVSKFLNAWSETLGE